MGKLILRYKRRLSEGGRCSGDIVFRKDTESSATVSTVCFAFVNISFKQMLEEYAAALCQFPAAEGWYQRIDKPGMPEGQWSPAHVQGLREDADKTIDELSNPAPVTYDMRRNKENES